MAIGNLFQTTTKADSPLDGSAGSDAKAQVSDFLTVQSFTNFAAMTGAITAAWNALQRLTPSAGAIWVPYAFAAVFAVISLLTSLKGLKKDGTLEIGTVFSAMFVGLINALVLAGAVVGTDVATSQGG
jgi:hypothetical protein